MPIGQASFALTAMQAGENASASLTSASAIPESVGSMDPDRSLIDRARSGDGRAFGDLTMRHRDRVYGQAFRILQDRPEAEDTTQDVFLKVYQSLDDFRGESKFSSWLYRVTANFSLMKLRALRLRSRYAYTSTDRAGAQSVLELMASELPDPFRALVASEGLRHLQEALAGLSSEAGELLYLKVIEGRTYEDLSVSTGIPLATVKTRIFRARCALLEALRRR